MRDNQSTRLDKEVAGVQLIAENRGGATVPLRVAGQTGLCNGWPNVSGLPKAEKLAMMKDVVAQLGQLGVFFTPYAWLDHVLLGLCIQVIIALPSQLADASRLVDRRCRLRRLLVGTGEDGMSSRFGRWPDCALSGRFGGEAGF